MTGETELDKAGHPGPPGVVLSSDGLDVLCWCGKSPAQDAHVCSYAQDVGGNVDAEYCTCCDECRRQCVGDI